MVRPLLFAIAAVVTSAASRPASGGHPSPVITAADQPPAPEIVSLDGAREVADLCAALTPVERMRFSGDALARGQAEAAHEAKRETAVARRYRVVVPASALAFEPYEPDDARLTLSRRASLAAAGGALHVWTAPAYEGLPVRVEPARARKLLEAASRGTLRLAITFDLPDDDEAVAPCTAVAGRPPYTLAIEPVAWTYLAGGEALARGGAESDLPLASAADGARPRVDVGEPLGEGGAAVRARIAERSRDLETCYAGALRRRPALDGTIVAELKLASAGGTPSEVRLAADSLQDAEVAACVRQVLARIAFPRVGGTTPAVPIRFLLEEPDR